MKIKQYFSVKIKVTYIRNYNQTSILVLRVSISGILNDNFYMF